jgi:hypothetical protein
MASDRKEFPDASVDLVYLDPPFNSNADYNVLFREPSGQVQYRLQAQHPPTALSTRNLVGRQILPRLRVKLSSVLLALFVTGASALAGEVDPRFHGTWVGTESFQGLFTHNQLGKGGYAPLEKPAMIAIGEGGTKFGIIKGLTPGLYDVSPKSNGNTLIFKLHDIHRKGVAVYFGRLDGQVILSPDGNILTEHGSGILPASGARNFAYIVITGTFHRVAK